MTLLELCQRMGRWSSAKSLSQMTVEDRLVLLDCINSATYHWFSEAPERYRQTTVSHRVRPPESGTVSVVDGSNELDLTLQQYHLGATIDVGGTNMNEIVSVAGTPTVLNEWRQTGSLQYTIYFDTIMLTDYSVSRIVSHPRILDTGVELYRNERIKNHGAERRDSIGLYGVRGSHDFGDPWEYTVENTGISGGDEARIMMRMNPIPQRGLTVTFAAAIDAATYDLDDLEGTTELVVPDQYVIPHVLPLALGELAVSPIWGEADSNIAIEKSMAIVHKLKRDLQPNHGTPQHYVRTRPGW